MPQVQQWGCPNVCQLCKNLRIFSPTRKLGYSRGGLRQFQLLPRPVLPHAPSSACPRMHALFSKHLYNLLKILICSRQIPSGAKKSIGTRGTPTVCIWGGYEHLRYRGKTLFPAGAAVWGATPLEPRMIMTQPIFQG